nr:YopT-type cysteine protease domain-containing protein [Bradyrhizobium sacchari]
MRQQRYEELRNQLQNDPAEDFQPKDIMLREARLQPSARRRRYEFGRSSDIARIVDEIAEDPSVYLLSLRFPEGHAHLVATSTSNGTTTLFDSNHGEFAVTSDRMSHLLGSLAKSCRDNNGHPVVMVVTQRMS